MSMDVFMYDTAGRGWARRPTRREIERRVVGWAAFGCPGPERTLLLARIGPERFADPLARSVWLHLGASEGPYTPADIALALGYPTGVLDAVEAQMRLLAPVAEIAVLTEEPVTRTER